MSKFLPCACALALAWPVLAAGQVVAPPARVDIVATRDAAWTGYRNFYKSALRWREASHLWPLIQPRLQIQPRREGLSLAGLRLELASETFSLGIDLDPIGRPVSPIPLLKTAFDEDAMLRLNRQAGNYRFSAIFSISENDEGVYRAPELRAACDQMLSAERAFGSRFRLMGKKCVAVTFIYPPASASAIDFRGPSGTATTIAAVDGTPFDPVPMGVYKVATYRFDAWPAQGDIVAGQRPLRIGAVYE